MKQKKTNNLCNFFLPSAAALSRWMGSRGETEMPREGSEKKISYEHIVVTLATFVKRHAENSERRRSRHETFSFSSYMRISQKHLRTNYVSLITQKDEQVRTTRLRVLLCFSFSAKKNNVLSSFSIFAYEKYQQQNLLVLTLFTFSSNVLLLRMF